MLRSLFFEANSGHHCRSIIKGPGKIRLGRADGTLASDFLKAGISPWRKGKRCENLLLCCAASPSQLWSGSSSSGQDEAKVGASSGSTYGRDFRSLTAFPRSRYYFEGWSTLSCTSEEVNRWQKKETPYRRLRKETFLLWQKSSLMIAAFSDIALRCQWNLPDNFLASLLEPGGDRWAQPFCTFFPEGLINSSWICGNPEDFLQGSNLLEHKTTWQLYHYLTFFWSRE